MKKIIIPEGMLKAAQYNAERQRYFGNPVVYVEPALRWLSENPIVPNLEEVSEMYKINRFHGIDKPLQVYGDIAVEWQRRMFLAPNPPPDPLVMYIMRHFDDLNMDPVTLRLRAESAVADWKHVVKE